MLCTCWQQRTHRTSHIALPHQCPQVSMHSHWCCLGRTPQMWSNLCMSVHFHMVCLNKLQSQYLSRLHILLVFKGRLTFLHASIDAIHVQARMHVVWHGVLNFTAWNACVALRIVFLLTKIHITWDKFVGCTKFHELVGCTQLCEVACVWSEQSCNVVTVTWHRSKAKIGLW